MNGLQETFSKTSIQSIFPSFESISHIKELTGLPKPIKFPNTKCRLRNADDLQIPTPLFEPSMPGPTLKANISQVRVLTSSLAKSKKLELCLDLDPNASQLHWLPGDAIGILPENPKEYVGFILSRLELLENADLIEAVESDCSLTEWPKHLPTLISAQDLFTKFLDLTFLPKKATLRFLAESCDKDEDKKVLFYLCSKEGANEWRHIQKEFNPNFLEILTCFPSCLPTLEQLISVLPPMQPRYYSLASSPLFPSQSQLHIAFTVHSAESTGLFSLPRIGICTTFLNRKVGDPDPSDLKRNEEPVWIEIEEDLKPQLNILFRSSVLKQPSMFTPPEDPSIPMILVSAGTGIAPFLGFIRHREGQLRSGIIAPNECGEILVFHGCRHPLNDQIFHWEPMFQSQLLFPSVPLLYEVAYSQQETAPNSKMYVQELLRVHSKHIYQLLMKTEAKLYICGDAKGMSSGVQQAITDILISEGDMEAKDATARILNWMKEKKYLLDLW